jgi:electron transport complex protein RnfE
LKYIRLLKNGIITENPIFIQVMALCPLLAVTTSALNAITMGLATTVVMICACAVISALRNIVPSEIRIAISVIVVAGFVTVVQFLMEAYLPPDINEALGIYIPLIVVNCILFARVEAFASKNGAFASAVDACGMGLGFTLGLFTVGVIREFLGSGSILGIELLHDPTAHMLIMVMAPGAFFTLGAIIMLMRHLQAKRIEAGVVSGVGGAGGTSGTGGSGGASSAGVFSGAGDYSAGNATGDADGNPESDAEDSFEKVPGVNQ